MKIKVLTVLFLSLFGTVSLFPRKAWATEEQKDLFQLVTASEESLTQMQTAAMAAAQSDLDEILRLKPTEITFENTFARYDRSRMKLLESLHFVELVSLVSPDSQKRKHAQSLAIALRQYLHTTVNEAIYSKLELSQAQMHLKAEPEKERLAQFLLSDMRHRGAGLKKNQVRLQEVRLKIAELESTFDKNVADLKGSIIATAEELQGVPAQVLSTLKRREADGAYVLGTDYPTVGAVLAFAHSPKIRQSVFNTFNNRAYPENYQVLTELLELRREFSELLGFSSYAHWELEDQMAGNPQTVYEFLNQCSTAARRRAELDWESLKPFGKAFEKYSSSEADWNEAGQFQPWSQAYLTELKAQKDGSLDSGAISEYFPVERALQGLFSILEKQFGVTVQLERVAHLWDPEIRVAHVSFQGVVRGQVFFDLYPRDGKYTHGRVAVLRPSSTNERVK